MVARDEWGQIIGPDERAEARSAQHVGAAATPAGEPRRFLALFKLAASIVAIAAVALSICCVLAVIGLLMIVASQGREGAAELFQRLEFDAPLRTETSAVVIGLLYFGVAAATLAASVVSARKDWANRLALVAPSRLGRDSLFIIALTLAYGAFATYTLAQKRHHSLVISGPTDYLLIELVAANLVLFAPIAEEVLFRGWLYTGLRRRLSFLPSFIVTAALFAGFHWSGRRILLVLPLALALGCVREFTGSIRPTLALHMCYNLLSVLITLAET